MSIAGPVKLRVKPKSPAGLVPVRMRSFGSHVLMTNPWGGWVFITNQQLDQLIQGPPEPGSDLETKLRKSNFLREHVDPDSIADKLLAKTEFQDAGPNLHIVVVTLRCNQTCLYCHASRADMSQTQTDMSVETADEVVDFIFQSTSPNLTIEFQGGEPLANFEVVRRVIERAKQKNQTAGKTLEFTLVSNLSLMDDEKLDYLIDNRVQICTSIDGPAALHDQQRILPKGSSYEVAVRWLRTINERYERMGLDPSVYHVEALLTTTRASLSQPRQIVDSFVELGVQSIFLRPLDPFGFAARTRQTLAYDMDAFLDYYREAVDYILELNRKGTQVLERFASIFLTKILEDAEPNYLDIRSPCGAGIGQLAYNYDGKIFTCDEGRMVHEMANDPFFQIGQVGDSRYRQVMLHETVRSMAMASNLEAQPDCVNCAYQPYCGTCPVHNYVTQGSIWGRARQSSLCRLHKGIQDYLFEKLLSGGEEIEQIFHRWTTVRPRTHFLQPLAGAVVDGR